LEILPVLFKGCFNLSLFGILSLTSSWALWSPMDRSLYELFKKPKFAKIGVRMQKLSLFLSLEFFSWCKSGVHWDFHREAGFNPAAPGALAQGSTRTGSTLKIISRRFFGAGPSLTGLRAGCPGT
jgi:hypothetical protein